MTSNPSKLWLLKSRPLCIICAKPKELETIAKTLGIFKDRISGYDIPEINDGHDFYLGTFKLHTPNGDRDLEFYATSALRQSIQTFTVHAGALFHVLRPKFAIHAGVCAGYVAKDIELEDVVFGDAAVNYEEGKWIIENEQKVFMPSFRTIEAGTGAISSFSQDKKEPKYKYGTYVSGAAVRQDATEILGRLRGSVDRDICALDMEASAFLMLCNYLNIGCLGIVKGVSDLGDSMKGRDPDTYDNALKETAEAVRKWAIYRLKEVHWVIPEDEEAGAHQATGYYENFVRVVLDAIAGKQEVVIREPPNNSIPYNEVKGMKIIMPHNNDPKNFGEHGHIARIVSDFALLEVNVGSGIFKRTLYYKAGYLIDFPRTINSFLEERDPVHQTEVFQRALVKRPYFNNNSMATVTPWQDFEEFVQRNPDSLA